MEREIPDRIVVRLTKLIELSTRHANYHDLVTISFPINLPTDKISMLMRIKISLRDKFYVTIHSMFFFL